MLRVFAYKNKYMHPICLSKEKFENQMELLLIGNEDKSLGNKSHYVYIKDFNRSM